MGKRAVFASLYLNSYNPAASWQIPAVSLNFRLDSLPDAYAHSLFAARTNLSLAHSSAACGAICDRLISLHLSVGVLIVLLVIVRFAYRLATPKVIPLPSTSVQINRLAHIGHMTLYVLLIALPLLGWANASSRGWDVSLFGIVPMPPLAASGSHLGHRMGDIHQLTAWVLLAVVGMHVAAALYHHFALRDETLSRMGVGRGRNA
jgi:cytochrome b561